VTAPGGKTMRITTVTMLLSLACVALAGSARAGDAAEAVPMTLDQALEAADERNLTLAGIRDELDRADGQLAQAWGYWLPSADASLSYTRMDHEDTADLTSGIADMLTEAFAEMPFEMGAIEEGEPVVIQPQDTLQGSVTVAMPVVAPAAWGGIAVARRGAQLTELSVEDARQELLLGVGQAWYAARMTGSLVGLAEAQVEAAEHHVRVAEAQLEAGAGLRLDQVRARADLAAARQDLLDARLAHDSTRDALGVLTGAGALVDPVGEVRLGAPDPAAPLDDPGLLAGRTDLRVAEAGVDLASGQLTAAKLQFLPTVSLAWQGSYQFTETSGLGSDDPSRWALVAQLDVPLYSHTRIGAVQESQGALRQARHQLEDSRRQAELETRQAARSLTTATAAVDIAGQQVELSDEAFQLALDAFEAGAGSSLEVTEARRSSASAQVNLATTRLEADLAALTLMRATGADMLVP
jgi:outer membrane protein TolC